MRDAGRQGDGVTSLLVPGGVRGNARQTQIARACVHADTAQVQIHRTGQSGLRAWLGSGLLPFLTDEITETDQNRKRTHHAAAAARMCRCCSPNACKRHNSKDACRAQAYGVLLCVCNVTGDVAKRLNVAANSYSLQ
jgi:hypothetical protein